MFTSPNIVMSAPLALAILGVAIGGCVSHAPVQQVGYTAKVSLPAEQYLVNLPQGLEVFLPVPENNPLTADKVELGRELFFEKRLSRDESASCATCHLPEKAFTDGLPISVGIDGALGRRNAPSLLNGAYLRSMFRDGRAKSLEEQALQPLTNPAELGNTHEEVVRRLGADKTYPMLFERAFGSTEVTIERTAEAIASFERTLLSADSEFDRYILSGERYGLSDSALRGLELVRGKARCQLCHEHSLLTDGRFHNTGVSWGEQPLDLGRHEVTGWEPDRGKFKTPSLRDVEHTAPYMHDGSIKTLEEVVEFYNKGGTQNPYLDLAIKPLDLADQEKEDLVAFLKSLSGTNWQSRVESLNMAHDSH